MISNFENIYDIYHIINDFISNFQKIFSVEEIDRILSQLLFDENPVRMNNLNESDENDDSQEPRFNHKFVDRLESKVIGYTNIDSLKIFMYDEEHIIPYIQNRRYMDSDYDYDY